MPFSKVLPKDPKETTPKDPTPKDPKAENLFPKAGGKKGGDFTKGFFVGVSAVASDSLAPPRSSGAAGWTGVQVSGLMQPSGSSK